MTDWSSYWWESITGPKNLTLAVARELREKGNVCLIVPDDLPWRGQMRATVEYELRQSPEMEDFDVDLIDVADECENVVDIGRYLLEKYGQPSVASGYRRREKIQQYMVQHRVLENRVLWVKGMNEDQCRKWIAFCKDYVPTRERDGRFVLECHTDIKESERRNLGIIHYSERINNFDLSLFNSTYINQSENRFTPVWETYAATLASVLCGTDAEISAALMAVLSFQSQEPAEALCQLAMDPQYNRRGSESRDHILSLVRDGNTDEVQSLIWKAQLQIIFPLVEIERMAFVEKYHDQINIALRDTYTDYQSGYGKRIKQFGEYVDLPENAELGTLYRLTKLRRDADSSQYLLYLPDEESRTRLELLHAVRNNLAHGTACSIGQVAAFIDSFPYLWK